MLDVTEIQTITHDVMVIGAGGAARAVVLAHHCAIRRGDELGARPDETRLVSEDDGLHAIPETELRQHMPDMRLHRSLADRQFSGDLRVGQPPGKLDEHLALPLGQHPQVPRWRRGRIGQRVGEPANER